MKLLTTASQTVGPFVAIAFAGASVADVAAAGVPGERATIRGRVVDGDGAPVSDAVIETWQANADGKYAHPEDCQEKPLVPGFTGFGRILTNREGAFELTTIKPGAVPGPDDGVQAPHLVVTIFMRGLLKHLVTRMYFPDDVANKNDPVLNLVAPERRDTLIARKSSNQSVDLRWDIILQGDKETVFFEY